MKVRLINIFLLAFFSVATLNGQDKVPLAGKGVLDLRHIKDPNKFEVVLNGEWEFYWEKMLYPRDFKIPGIVPDYYAKVPSYWSDYKSGPAKGEKFGYATYRITVLLPDSCVTPLGIDLPVFDSSYDIYIDNRYYGGNGMPGKNSEETKPEYRRNFYRIASFSKTLTIEIIISNFHHRRGGFWLPVRLGTFNEVQKTLSQSWAGNWSVITLLLAFSLFCFFFYLINRKEKILFFFGLTTTGLALRPFFTSHYLILNLININWIWMVRCEYLGLYLIMFGWTWFVNSLYPSKFIKFYSRIISSLFVLGVISTLILPVRIFSYTMVVYYPLMLILIAYLIYKSVLGSLKGNWLDIVYLTAFIFLLAAGINDIRLASGKSGGSTDYLLTYFIVIFVFIQVALLLYKWVRAFQENEKLKNELEYLNRNLEVLVSDRTKELEHRNLEIENQNLMIAQQNIKLSDTIQVKNRIFSVIAHDLRSPVVNILYMLNLLKEKEYREKYDTFANSSIQYAQQVINLLENMLVWGRGQEEKIKFSPEKRDLADIVLTNLSIFKERADEKDISVNFTQVGNSMAFIDKDLLDIIIRNLLSNSLKYTHRGGRISILLKDKGNSGEGILLKICDNGIGIPIEKQELLFTGEEVNSSPGTENEKGTGFGLKLCYELVKINNGNISIESKPDEGTCFLITLPKA